jgi:hypothetical protein
MKTWIVKPCTARELAELYEVSYRVFKGHLKRIDEEVGRRIGHFYTVKQVMTIIEHLGPPPNIEVIYSRKVL